MKEVTDLCLVKKIELTDAKEAHSLFIKMSEVELLSLKQKNAEEEKHI